MSDSKMRVGVSPLTNTIYCGRVKGAMWSGQKHDVTMDALVAVAEHALKFGKPVVIHANGKPELEITVRHLSEANQGSKSKFVVIVESEEARSSYQNALITYAGEKFIATVEPEGWVEATSSRWHGSVPKDAKIFPTIDEAEKFARRWKGHPWWCSPNGNYEIIEVVATYKQVFAGYAVANQEKGHAE